MNTQQYTNTLKEHRNKHGLLQSQVAHLLGLNGPDRISYWEKGTATPSLTNLLKLCILYKADPLELYGELVETITKELEENKLLMICKK